MYSNAATVATVITKLRSLLRIKRWEKEDVALRVLLYLFAIVILSQANVNHPKLTVAMTTVYEHSTLLFQMY